MRSYFLFLLALVLVMPLGAQDADNSAPQTTATREYIVVSGGPALRFFEHGKAASHDEYWFNFIDASTMRLQQLKQIIHPGDLLTWLVYRPSYISRGQEMETDLISQVQTKARALGARLIWFNTPDEFIAYLNRGQDRDKVKIYNFDYIGHSNKACFLFDYSNQIDNLSTCFFHVDDLKKIDNDILAPQATCQSWGCHSGEMFSQYWKQRFSVPMIGAIGKTDFSHGRGLPVLSNSDGKWVQ